MLPSRDFAETGNTAASNVPIVNEKTIIRRDIMVWPFLVPIALYENSTGERELLTRPGDTTIMVPNLVINVERSVSYLGCNI
jgi:hypothetical protein